MELGSTDHSAYAPQEFPVCGALAPYEFDALVNVCLEVRCSPRQTVFFEGDEAKGFYIVGSGAASSCKSLGDGRRQVTGFLYPADFCGLAIGGRYTNSVEAITDLTLYYFARRDPESLLETFPTLQRRMLSQADNALATAQEQLVLLGCKNATERVASFLLKLSERFRKNGLCDNPIWLPMTRRDIGDYLGLTTETASRMFTQLERCGAITRLSDAKIDLTNRAMLQDIAEGG